MPLPLLVAGGAVLGAAVSGGLEYWSQRRSGRPVDWSKIGRAAALGAAVGAIGGVTGTAARAVMLRAGGETAAAVVKTGRVLTATTTLTGLSGKIGEGVAASLPPKPAARPPAARRAPVPSADEGEVVELGRVVGRWTDPVSGQSYPTTRAYVVRGKHEPAPPRGWPSLQSVPDLDQATAALNDLAGAIGGTPNATDITAPIGRAAERPIRAAITRSIDGRPTDADRAVEAMNALADQLEAQNRALGVRPSPEPKSRGMLGALTDE